jgi:hypothetical protein
MLYFHPVMVIYFYLLSMKCAHILLENLSISYSDCNLLFYLWPSHFFMRFFRSMCMFVFICFWICVYIIILISICICLKHFYLTSERKNWLSNILALSVPDKGYSRNVPCALNLISTFYYNRWADTSAGRLLVPAECIMWPVISVSALTWFIRYIFYWNLQFPNHVIIIKTKVLFPQT